MTAQVLVHADGGACHGTPIVDGRCPKCGIAPDTQSLEMWPQPAERRPCVGWYEQSPGRWWLDAGPLTADASGDPGSVKWSIEVGERSWARGTAPTLDAAMIAAEDAMLAVADEIRRAVAQ